MYFFPHGSILAVSAVSGCRLRGCSGGSGWSGDLHRPSHWVLHRGYPALRSYRLVCPLIRLWAKTSSSILRLLSLSTFQDLPVSQSRPSYASKHIQASKMLIWIGLHQTSRRWSFYLSPDRGSSTSLWAWLWGHPSLLQHLSTVVWASSLFTPHNPWFFHSVSQYHLISPWFLGSSTQSLRLFLL